VRNLIAEHGLDPAAIPASGRGGRLTKGDVLMHLERRLTPAPAAAPAPPAVTAPAPPRPGPRPAPAGEARQPISRIRRRIAERLVAAEHRAALTPTSNELGGSAMRALATQYKDRCPQKQGVGLAFMSSFARACTAALREIPAVNAEIDGDDIVYKHFVHLGVAVGTERGLVVPVVRHADAMSFAELEREICRLAGLARGRQHAAGHP